jgi:hypothetical protein
MTTSERASPGRGPRPPLRVALLLCASLTLSATHPGWAEPAVPTLPAVRAQDNELIISAEGGGWGAPARAGASAALWIGLMNRAWDWLDAELAMGALALLGGDDDTFSQGWRGRSHQQRSLWGGAIRGGVRAHSASLGGLGIEAGLRVSVLAAPLQGTLTRAEVEVGLSIDCWRSDRDHGVASILYLIPLWEGLTQEPGLDFTDPVHAVQARFSFGF